MKALKYRMNRKGTVFDIIPIIILMLILGIGVLIGTNILSEFKVKLVDEGGLNSVTAQNILTNANTNYSVVWDIVIPFIFVGLCIGMIVSAFMVKTYPVFFICSIFMLVLFILVVPVISNAFEQFCNDLSTECTNYTKTQYIFDYMPVILTMIGVITCITLYAVFKL